ncbi:P-loop containing nucleoside triphosphate hydrolase protein [Sparassis latifolia]
MSSTVICPVCSRSIREKDINQHLDNNCLDDGPSTSSQSRFIGSLNARAQRKLQPPITSLFNSLQKSDRPLLSSPTPSSQISSAKAPNDRKRREIDNSHMSTEKPEKRTRLSASSRLHSAAPLADRLRPSTLDEFVGQSHLLGPGSLLLHLLNSGTVGNVIFWGPPGCGKTTLARLLAKRTDSIFKELSATDSGISDVRAIVEEAKTVLALTGRRTILFLDEVHRFNKAQQDIFLPYLEQGHVQNVSSKVMQRSVFVLERLTDEDINRIVTQAVERVTATAHNTATKTADVEIPSSQPETELSLSQPNTLSPAASSATQSPFPSYPQLNSKILSSIVSLSTGDARTALSLLELVLSSPADADPDQILSSLRRSVSTSYDRTGESHYDMISALHKSVRGSQGSAALYWLARMLSAGEDPLYVARRMVVCASEDVGLADNHALPLAMATYQACQVIGMPECRINLAHLVSYLSEAPKSTRSYGGYCRAEEAAKLDPTIPVPLMVRNAPTKLMKELGYSRGYHYNPDYSHPVTNDYLPVQFRGDVFLKPDGDTSDKIWDEAALREWELEENGGKPWSGRPKEPSDQPKEPVDRMPSADPPDQAASTPV